MILKETIDRAIDSLQIDGADVCIHSSMRAFGERIEGGAEGVIDAFLLRDCTVMAPTFSDCYEQEPVEPYMPERNGTGDYGWLAEKTFDTSMIFTVDSKLITSEDMGVLPTKLLERQDARRGYNPLDSFAAVGPDAAALVGVQSPENVYGPLEELCKRNGYVLLMGVTLENATIVHYAEQCAGHRPFIRWANDPDGKVMPVSAGGCSDGFEEAFGKLAEPIKRFTVGACEWRLYNAKSLAETCTKAILENPTITHCADADCERCVDMVKGGPILPENFWPRIK